MNIEIPIQGQSASGGVPPVQPPVPPTQPPTQPQTQPTDVFNPNNNLGGSGTRSNMRMYERGDVEMNNRMIEDVRREMQQRGVLMVPGSSSMSQFINQYGSNLIKQESGRIHNEYDELRAASKAQRDNELSRISNEVKKEAKKYADLRDSGVMTNDEAQNAFLNSSRRKQLEEEVKKVNAEYESDINAIDRAEDEDKLDANKDLTKAIRDLTRYFERESRENVNEDSYINQLKKQREEAIFERDNVDDEEQAREASRRANELGRKIKDIESEGEEENEEKAKDYGARILQMINGVGQFSSGMMNRNIGGMITGAGSVITNVLPLSDENQATAMKWLASAGLIGGLIQQPVEKENALAGLAAIMRGRNSISDTRKSLYGDLWNYSASDSLPGIFDFGMDIVGFAKSAERRMSQRGIGGWKGVNEAYYQEGLERALSLQSGSLGQAGMYDRYGINITDAISTLTSALKRDRFSGVKEGDYVRMEEYLKLQQGLMQSQLGFAGTPSYNYANEMISRFANMKGYQVDSRTGSDIQALQGMVLNPGNDRQRAILYSVVEQMFPETRGRMDLIERYTQDPAKMSQIQQGYIKRIQGMYGSTDTEMGYFAAKAALPGIASAERRDAVWRGMQTNNYAPVDIKQDERDKYIQDIHNYTSNMTETLIDIQEALTTGVNWLLDKIGSLVNN